MPLGIAIVKSVMTLYSQAPWDAVEPKERTLDAFTKKALYTAHCLFAEKPPVYDGNDTGVVLSANEGPVDSLRDAAARLREGDYRRINPSYFPNVMLSTALFHLTKALDTHGPAACFFEGTAQSADALEYAETQLRCGHCGGMVYIRVQDGTWGIGRMMTISRENEDITDHESSVYQSQRNDI